MSNVNVHLSGTGGDAAVATWRSREKLRFPPRQLRRPCLSTEDICVQVGGIVQISLSSLLFVISIYLQVVGSLDIFNILNIINILAYLNNPNILNIINILDILNFFFLTFRLLAHLDNDHETEDFVRVEGGTYSSHFIVNEV